MKISIITVCFNREKTIAQAIESVLNQTYGNIEYIIVDGASTDSTVQIAESYSEKFAEKGIEYRIISEPDNGIYDAMNKGIRMSTGEIVGMINSDDWYETDAISKVAKTYAHTNFDLMFATLRIHTGKAILLKKPKIKHFVSTRHWNHPTMFVAKSVYNQELYAVNNVYDDLDFYLRIRGQNKKIITIDDVLANYRFGGATTKKNMSDVIKRIRIRYNIYRKNGYSHLYFFECIITEFTKFILA